MILESLKNFFTVQKDKQVSSEVEASNIVANLTDDTYNSIGAFFDNEDVSGIYSRNLKSDLLEKQKIKITTYRNLAKTPDVNDAIEEIVNEVSFSLTNESPLIIEIDEENDKIKEKIEKSFDRVCKLLNIKKNLYTIIKNGYIDGQLNLHCTYNPNGKDGIQGIKILEPLYFDYDPKTEKYKYNTTDKSFFARSGERTDIEYEKEEIVRTDYGLYEDGVCLSYLEYAIKPANQLRTLEDLLIPMRFSRSVSRRVFNVDVGDLPNKKAEESMREIQNKFKYKKFYNVATGEISNQQHITSMVEDYWFANRNGGKGTTADTLDETGNLGELNDILYFNKKLYKSMFIPSNRISINPDEDSSFDYETTTVSKEDIKFFMFVSRIRNVYSEMFLELLRRELISTGVLTDNEWGEYKDKIYIKFRNENKFIEKMDLDIFRLKLNIYRDATEFSTKLFSVSKLLKTVFKYSDKEIEEMLKEVEKEEKNTLFAKFYVKENEF